MRKAFILSLILTTSSWAGSEPVDPSSIFIKKTSHQRDLSLTTKNALTPPINMGGAYIFMAAENNKSLTPAKKINIQILENGEDDTYKAFVYSGFNAVTSQKVSDLLDGVREKITLAQGQRVMVRTNFELLDTETVLANMGAQGISQEKLDILNENITSIIDGDNYQYAPMAMKRDCNHVTLKSSRKAILEELDSGDHEFLSSESINALNYQSFNHLDFPNINFANQAREMLEDRVDNPENIVAHVALHLKCYAVKFYDEQQHERKAGLVEKELMSNLGPEALNLVGWEQIKIDPKQFLLAKGLMANIKNSIERNAAALAWNKHLQSLTVDQLIRSTGIKINSAMSLNQDDEVLKTDDGEETQGAGYGGKAVPALLQ